MRRWLAVLVLASVASVASVAATGCGSDDDESAAPATTTTSPGTSVASSVPATTTAPVTQGPATTATTTPASTAPPTTSGQAAAKAIIEPNAVAGIALGSNKSQAIAVLGPPTTMGQEADLSGKTYDYLRWQFSGNRGLFLNFRTESVTSPLLTDWIATAPGPATKGGVQVGDGAAKVVAAHGALQAFCCNAQVASVTEGAGRMIVVVANDNQQVTQIIGGDPGYWSRSIAD